MTTDVSVLHHRPAGGTRSRSIDNLKVVLVIGVIVGHATMAWTGVGDWVFTETPVREPLLTVLVLVSVVTALFAIPVFFFVAGLFTPPSLRRKGLGPFVKARMLRLGVPMLFFIVFISPLVEYVDPGWEGWDQGFLAFLPEVWWPPAPGPTWFLGVLLVFSIAYAVVRTLRPQVPATPGPPRPVALAVAVTAMTAASYVIRIWVPLGVEAWRLALGQAPAWITGFTLGVLASERGWVDPVDEKVSRIARRTAWSTAAGIAVYIVAVSQLTGAEMEAFAGGGTALSLIMALLEATLLVSMSLWLVDVFARRWSSQGRLGRAMSRAAFAAFVIHQIVLVWLVLASRLVDLAPEIEYLGVSTLAVLFSFGLGTLALRLPGVSKVVG
jgi:glucans biosynthesis protein C